MLVIAAPGQGAQAPGFLTPWLDLPGVADRLAAWSDLAGCDLISCGTTAGAEEITDPAIAQPLLVAAAIAIAASLGGGAEPSAGLDHIRRRSGRTRRGRTRRPGGRRRRAGPARGPGIRGLARPGPGLR